MKRTKSKRPKCFTGPITPEEIHYLFVRPVYVTIEFELWGMVGRETVEVIPWPEESISHLAFRAGAFFGSQVPKRIGAKMKMVRITNMRREEPEVQP